MFSGRICIMLVYHWFCNVATAISLNTQERVIMESGGDFAFILYCIKCNRANRNTTKRK